MNKITTLLTITIMLLMVSSAEAQTFGLGQAKAEETPGSLFGLARRPSFFQERLPKRSLSLKIEVPQQKKGEVKVQPKVVPQSVVSPSNVVCANGTCTVVAQPRQIRKPFFRRWR